MARPATRRERQRRRQRRRLARRPSAALRALTSGAMALPGLAQRAGAETAPLEARADYQYSRYSEDDLSTGKVAVGGERSRYEIDIHQFRFETPLGERFGLGVDLVHETMSGATPWYVTPGAAPGDDPVQVMTEATIDEQRTDALLTGTAYLERGRADAALGVSVENDYLAFNGRLGGERQFNEKNTTVSGGVGASYDIITPSGRSRFPTRPGRREKQTYDVVVGVSQVLGRATVAQTSLKYQHARGFLSDPYKLAFVGSAPERDRRPNLRHQFAWLTRLRHRFERIDGTLHFDYQLYTDDWDVTSHAFELAWYQVLFDRFRLIPSLRYYSQSQAEFYAPFFVGPRSDGKQTSDYRLSPYGALSYRLEAQTRFQTWSLLWDVSFAWERYTSDGALALQNVSVENPGLVSYHLISAGVTLRF